MNPLALARRRDTAQITIRQLAILVLLNEGPNHNAAMATIIGANCGATHRNVSALAADGWVVRHSTGGPAGYHPVNIEITDKGRALLAELRGQSR